MKKEPTYLPEGISTDFLGDPLVKESTAKQIREIISVHYETKTKVNMIINKCTNKKGNGYNYSSRPNKINKRFSLQELLFGQKQ